MHKKFLKCFSFCVAVCGLSVSPALSQQYVNVKVESTAKDELGKRLTYQFRELINASSSLIQVFGDEAAIQVNLVTLDPDDKSSYGQSQTVYSMVLSLKKRGETLPLYLTQTVGNCGRNKLNECAASFVADVAEWGDAVRKLSTQ